MIRRRNILRWIPQVRSLLFVCASARSPVTLAMTTPNFDYYNYTFPSRS